jgi:hypothetical protein
MSLCSGGCHEKFIILLKAALSPNLGCPSAVEAVIHRNIKFFIVAVSSTLGCPYVVEVIIFLRAAMSTTLGCPSMVEADINRVIIFLRVAVSTTLGCPSVVEAVIKIVGKWLSSNLSYVKWFMLLLFVF